MLVALVQSAKSTLSAGIRSLHFGCNPQFVRHVAGGTRAYSSNRAMSVPDPTFPTLMTPYGVQRKIEKSRSVRVLDCSWHFPSSARDANKEYLVGHIPTSLFFDVNECADRSSGLPHMLPTARVFEDYVGERGIHNETHVIVYDTSEMGMFSCQRVWWTFRVFGHEKVSILDGGFQKWKDEGFPETDEVESPPLEEFVARYKPNLVRDFEDVETNLKDQAAVVMDARPPGRFEGREPEPREGTEPGRMPESINVPFGLIMDSDKKILKSEMELRKVFDDHNIDLMKPLIATCGSGMTASGLALAAFLCGNYDVSVYDGSWAEWYARAKPEDIVRY
ncbi:PREDICTED: 3-mercaptopyruvate sulfurtransferase-like [Priapulus caudatus]|uniref:Sulfurtransferase n=1 Tax=Priapulus caudatus TaxID=37621 RepID=A0ABM1E8W6_PRICU|nr:PREDICTED: 3-mercaptopyruvate sulfurtransferase-like [Priapulus caudatus]